METFGTCWCQCCKQTNIPDGTSTLLIEIPAPSPVPEPAKPKVDEKQLMESIAITMNEFDKELGSFLDDCNKDYIDVGRDMDEINEKIRE